MSKVAPFPRRPATTPHSNSDFDEICTLLAGYLDGTAKLDREFCRFVGVLPELQRIDDAVLLREAKMVAGYLARGEVNGADARAMVSGLTRRLPPFTAVPALHVMLGVLMFIGALLAINGTLSYLWQTSAASPVGPGFWQLLGFLIHRQSTAPDPLGPGFYLFNVSPWLVIAIASAGGLGSIVSILTRLHAFGGYASMDRRLLWMIGAMRPVIGIVFALFVFAVLQAPILPFNFGPGPQANFEFIALAFIAGFSERFARGIITTVEGRFAGEPKA